MAQEHIWEKEYKNPQLVTKGDKPQSDTLDFIKYLRKERGVLIEGLKVLDLGCGTGRNSNYLAKEGARVIGIEISTSALRIAIERATIENLSIEYTKGDIGKKLAFENTTFDLILDVTSSNSLNEKEREIYAQEMFRVLKSGGYIFVKALCKDGDHNAKNLLKISPGSERDTYIMPELGLIERVWSKEDFINFYTPFFIIEKLERKTNYSKMNGRSYKRNFWLAYLKKE